MRALSAVAVLSLLALTACSSRVIVAKPAPDPAPSPSSPTHSVRGPVASLGIPPGHYPPPGKCRVWIPGRPPGRQARPAPCQKLGDVPLGAWVLHRSASDQKVIEVAQYDPERPKVVISVSYYDADTGTLVSVQGVN